MRSFPVTVPTMTLPLAVVARSPSPMSSVDTSPLAVLMSAAPTVPVTSMSAAAVANATSLPSGSSTRTVTGWRRRNRLPCWRGTFTTTVCVSPSGRHSMVVRSTSSSAAGVSAVTETVVATPATPATRAP